MTCAHCGSQNPAGKRFCGDCGAALEHRCPSCGADNPPGKKFCGDCGTALQVAGSRFQVPGSPDTRHLTPETSTGSRGGPRPSPPQHVGDKAEVRKVVTIVFADLIGSTALHERLDPESVSRVMERYHRAVRAPVEAHGGTVVQLLGDGVMCAFGVPRVAEDDALRAVRAAVGIQDAFREFARAHAELVGTAGLRVAVNTGEVVVSDDYAAGIGDPLNVAARLQQEARDGDVLIGESTERLVRDRVTLEQVGTFSLRGRTETVTAYRVVSLERPAGVPATPFVGRDDELRRLAAVYEAAVTAPAARLAVILGSPGLGKSRLLDECGRRLGDGATVLSTRCDAAGGATFTPLAEAVRGVLLRAAQASPAPAQGVALGSGLAALSGLRPGQSGDDQQPRRGDQPIAGGNAPGGGGAAQDLATAIAAVLSGDPDRDRIAAGIAALLGGSPAAPEETFFVVRRFLAAWATTRPVVLAIDDLQWAEPLLFDLIEHLVQWGSGVPLLVLAAARPELRDARSSLAAAGRLVSDVVTLSGLDAAAATRLAADVVGADALPAAVAGRVLATSEGNPLFVGELVRMLVNDGALKREGDRWTAGVDLAALQMPPTIQALLAARIERLNPEERTMLERAAVVGRRFSRAAVAALLPAEWRPQLDARLEALRRSELVEPDTSWFLGEPALRFHHGLTRDAAYRRVLKETRAELHGRLADWITATVGEAIEYDEMIGWHLEQAHQHLRELGPVDAQGRALGERAAGYLAAAGRRALARDDLPVAADLLGRAIDRLDQEDAARAELALDWCEALLAAGDVGHARAAIDELARFIGAAPFETPPEEGGSSGRTVGYSSHESIPARAEEAASVQRPSRSPHRLRAWHTCFAGQLTVLTDPQALHGTTQAVSAAAEELAAAGDAAGEAHAHLVHALALSRLGKVGACEAALDRALAAARRGDDRRRANTVLANAPLAALWGPSPVTRASGRCLDVVRVLRITQGAPAVEAVALRCQAVLEALRGRSEAARRMIASARHMVEELGITQQLLETDVFAGLIELLEGDAAAAAGSLRRAYEGLRDHGLGIDAARAAAFLGRALLVQARAAEAETVSHDSEALAGDDLQAAITWRGVRAEALASRGEHVAAVDIARTAVDLAAATDALLLHADARQALAEVLRTAGRGDDAFAEEVRAIELWEAKGATVLAERARLRPEAFGGRARRGAGRTAAVEPPLPVVDSAASARPVCRRVEANAATAHTARVCATIAARDADALPALVADGGEVVYHPTRSVYDMKEALRSWRSLMKARDGTLVLEPLATLGDSLALCRHLMSATGATGEKFDVGAYEVELITLVEVDERGRRRRSEFFALERLGDAVARLYERHAELLPDGLARTRAAATARSVAALFRAPPDRWPFAPDVEATDGRTVGFGALRGADAVVRAIRALMDLVRESTWRCDDVLGLRSDALLLRWTQAGTDRAGGEFERRVCHLWIFGSDGLATHWAQSDAEQEAEALARFDELVLSSTEGLTAEPAARAAGAAPQPRERRKRRLRANAATAHAARVDAAIASKDADALATLVVDDVEVVDHTTGGILDRDGVLFSYRSLLHAQDLTFRHEPLAALGDSLALCRQSLSASSFTGGTLDVGAFEKEQVILIEADAPARARRTEEFALDRLGDAVARLYERYAELLPDGPERDRAAATARSVAATVGPFDLGRYAAAFASRVEAVDHRTLGTWSAHGTDALLEHFRSLLDLVDDAAMRAEDILALTSDAFLIRWTNAGTQRTGGGAYERQFLNIWVFGADGLGTRMELFDADRRVEALTRFDEIAGNTARSEPSQGTAGPPAAPGTAAPTPSAAPRIANAATRFVESAIGALDARDWERFAALYAAGFRNLDRRRLIRLELDRDQHLEKVRQLYRLPTSRYTYEQLATRGDRLAMGRVRWTGSNTSIGPSELEWLEVFEVNDRGQLVTDIQLDPDDLNAAYAELEERSAAGEAAPYAATLETMQRLQGAAAARDWEALSAVHAPDFVVEDHSPLGWGTLDRPAYLESVQALAALAPDSRIRTDHLWLCDRGALGVHVELGTREGGAFEQPRVTVSELDAHGRERRRDVYTLGQLDEAQARFEEIGAGSSRQKRPAGASHWLPIPPNAATRASDRAQECLERRDWEALRTLCAPILFEDRRRLIRTTGGCDMAVANGQVITEAGGRFSRTVLATAGQTLVLERILVTGPGTAATFEVEAFRLLEVDGEGRLLAAIIFDPDDRRAASLELLERFARSEGAECVPALVFDAIRAVNAHDIDRLRAALPDDFVLHDHRHAGLGRLEREDYLASLAALFEEAPDLSVETLYDIAVEPHGMLVVARNFGSLREGGAFEQIYVRIMLVRDDRLIGVEMFEPEDLDAARSRFEELRRAEAVST
jgi:class 3 adenylate cyclase/tetratricopeptide (TPR) repeat protein